IVKLTAASDVVYIRHDSRLSDAEPEQAEEDCTDLSYLKTFADGSNEFIAEMVEVFLQQTPRYIEELQRHCKEQDWDALKAVAHKMRPTVAYMGIKKLETLIREIEEFAKLRKHLDRLPGMIENLVKVCKKALRELEIKLSEIKLPET
ncbi:MAG: Hpt domain-containing protein, partial [Chlorobiales bacterium]|nr:Hpt domain-containing protein [Chlorobiales bacterium]